MRVFDSNTEKKWNGRGIRIDGVNIVMGKSAKAEHLVFLDKGKHNFKIIGRKRTGNGKVKIMIIAEDGSILMEEEISFSKSSWTEFSYTFETKINYSRGKIKITRPQGVFGSIELGRVLLEKETPKIEKVAKQKSNKFEKPKVARAKRLHKMPRNYNKPVKSVVPSVLPPTFKKRVAFIIPYGIFGGAEVYVRNLILNMTPDITEVTVLYMAKNPLRGYLDDSHITHRICRNLEQLSGVLVTEQYDSIVFYNRGDIYKKLSKLRQDNQIHAKVAEIYHSDFLWSGAVAHFRKRKNVDVMFRVSDSLANDITGIKDKNKVTLPVGIDLEKFHVRWKEDLPSKIKSLIGDDDSAIIMGTVARLSKEKNIDYILDLAKIMDDCWFVVIGSGPEGGRLNRRIADEEISNVIMTGFIKNPENYYNLFDGFILASDIEGTPISILEAMASETVVFSNMVGAIPTIVEDGETGFAITGDPKVDAEIVYDNIFDLGVASLGRAYVEEYHDIKVNTKIFVEEILGIGNFHIKIDNEDGDVLTGEYV